MKLNFFIYSTVVVSLWFSSCTQDKTNQADTIEITWIEATDSIPHFQSLLATNYLYYLRHMSVDYDNYGTETWKSIDTLENNKWTMTRFRKGLCKESTDATKTEFCMERQKHVINKKINKVIKFDGIGSGYFANIGFVYDEEGKLIEYNENNNKMYYLKYDTKNQLTEITKTEIQNGIKRKTGLIKFK